MKNTRKILFSAALLSSGLTMAQTTTAEKSPNVIYIMADDLGIGDLGCYGQRQIKTPNIDGIAQNGMKFMQHYSGSTVSAPSRCALITGKHMGHAAIRGNAKVAGSDGLLYETPLPAGEVTVADIFKTKNYVTGCVGKWGMGGPGTVIFLKSGRFSDHTSLRTSLTSVAYLSSSFWAFSPEVASNISSSRKKRVVFMVMAFYIQLFV